MSDIATKINELETLLPNLPRSARNFADSLINGRFGYRARTARFSPKQVAAVDRLLEQAKAPKPVRETAELGSTFKGLIDIFQRAKVHLKFPKIRLQLSSGEPVVLSLLGPRSPNHGSVKVYNGVGYGQPNARWYGNVSPEGTWTKPGREFEEIEEVQVLLEKMAKDPAGTAAEYGRLTGQCCFCNQGLKDERSTEVGYGPICAKHYGLPWG